MKIRVPLILRNIVLRLLLMSALSWFIIGILEFYFLGQKGALSPESVKLVFLRGIIPPILIILHHTLRLWPRKYWWFICEVLVSLAEVVTTGFFFAPELPRFIQEINAGLPRADFFYGFSLDIACAVSEFVIVVSSFILFVFLSCDILNDHGRSFLHPYDFSVGLCPPGYQWRFICGRFVVRYGSFVRRRRFSTDNRFIQYIRAVLAFLCIFAILALVIYALILQPVKLRGQQGIRISKISVINGETQAALSTALGSPLYGAVFFQVVVTVKNSTSYPHITFAGDVVDLPVDSCQHSPTFNGTVLAHCYPGVLKDLNNPTEFLIIMNLPEMSYGNQLYLGIGLFADEILAGAEPIEIVPGYNVRGLASISVKGQILNEEAATFGIPQYRRFGVINVNSLSPDPSNSPQKDNRTTTLRIQMRPQQYIEVEQEYVENSVINGFALVGGVWTLVNGVFAAIFGSTLLLVLCGIKPLSIYGLIHLFRPGRGSLADGGYVLSSAERDRIVGILREHLLDVESAGEERASSPHYSPVSALPQSTCLHCGGGAPA